MSEPRLYVVPREEIPKRRESEHASVPLLFGAGIYKGAARASLYAPRVVQKAKRNEDRVLGGGIHYVRIKRYIPPRLCAGT